MNQEDIQKNLQKQIYLIGGVILFIFINIFVFDNKETNGFSIFSTIGLLTIGLLSSRKLLQGLGIISYLINVLMAFTNFNYIGWLTAVQAIELIFIIYYLYPGETFLKTDRTDRLRHKYRIRNLWKGILIVASIWLTFLAVSYFWNETFLEFGATTALIFAIQYFLFSYLIKSKAKEENFIEKQLELEDLLIDSEDEKKSLFGLHKTGSLMMMVMSLWLFVLDLSVVSYVFLQNNHNFESGALIVLTTLVATLFIGTPAQFQEDRFSYIYQLLRPLQPLFFLILLISHAHKITLGIFYAILFAIVYYFWAKNRINMKTLLIISVLIYFMPFVGFIPNPYRLGAKSLSSVGTLIVKKGKMDYFNFINWIDNSSIITESDQEKSVNSEVEKEAYPKRVILDGRHRTSRIGNDKELLFKLKRDGTVTISNTDNGITKTYKDLKQNRLSKVKEGNSENSTSYYKNYFYLAQIKSNDYYQTYYLKMSDEWLDDYIKVQDSKKGIENSKIKFEFIIGNSDIKESLKKLSK
ncbi:hypothetical protein [Streptococcus parauberis]|uniref:hypothetical protein n=1 Tax=Streptococcus parauberis TaxID=1348 RepID=UPI000CCF7ED3|nr:hypothetical protein [Streptococcus parauberis]PNY18928.1 hypothetical protein ASN86_00785 [Streptococcus parauberis]